MAPSTSEQPYTGEVLKQIEEHFPFLDGLPQFAWVADLRGRVLYFNEWARDYTGIDLNICLKDCWSRIIHPGDRALVQSLAVEFSARPMADAECRVRRADGEYRWHQVRWNDHRNSQLQDYAIGCFTEFRRDQSVRVPHAGLEANLNETERLRFQFDLLASEERFRLFMDNSPAVALIKDDEGRYLYVNSAWRKQFSPEPTDWLGKTDYDFWPTETAELFRTSDRECLARNELSQWKETAITPSRGEVTWWVTKFPLKQANKRSVGCIASSVLDIFGNECTIQLFHRTMEIVPQGIVVADANLPNLPLIYVSPGFEKITGYSAAETVGRNCKFLQGPGSDPQAVETIRRGIRDRVPVKVELVNYRKDGRMFINSFSLSPLYTAGYLTHFVGISSDVTERRNFEEQFRQSQKMEAVGILAGGISHDFNNLLTIMVGYCDLVYEELPDNPIREKVGEIRNAGRRAAALTQQLLAFSHRSVLEHRLLNVNYIVENIGSMLLRLVGKDIEFVMDLDPNLGRVMADRGQLEQAVMNLCINARDAMPDGGRLTVSTRNSEPHILISIADTGKGMTEEVKARAFEPFFTTKGPNRGTGLGLALVFNFVQQSGGQIEILSEPDRGAEFLIRLPQITEGDSMAISQTDINVMLPCGGETILLVEDELNVRELTKQVLEACGYTILEARDGTTAIEAATNHPGPIHLLLSDLKLPHGIRGKALAEVLQTNFPAMRHLFASGLNEAATEESAFEFLQKPYTPTTLTRKVRAILDHNDGTT